MKRILPLSAAAILLSACSTQRFYEPGQTTQVPVQPIVPVQLPNPLDLPGKNLPT